MSILMMVLVASTVVLVTLLWLRLTPSCPRCRGRSYDRRLCKPLLLCRRCATRCDVYGRAYN
jgi:hypothetical protein